MRIRDVSPEEASAHSGAAPLGWGNFWLRRAAGIKHPREAEIPCKQKKKGVSTALRSKG